MKTLTLEFDSEESYHNFVGWFLDGGGEQDFDHTLDDEHYYSTRWLPVDSKIEVSKKSATIN